MIMLSRLVACALVAALAGIAQTEHAVRLEVRRGHNTLAFVRAVALSRDGRFALSSGDDQAVVAWNVTSGKVIRRTRRDGAAIHSVSLSADGRLALVFGISPTVLLWNVATGEETALATGARDCYDGAFSPDARYALAATDRGIIVWDLQTRRKTATFGSAPYRLAVVDDHRVMAFDVRGVIQQWDYIQGVSLSLTSMAPYRERGLLLGGFSADGRRLAICEQPEPLAAPGRRSSVEVYDSASGKRLHTLELGGGCAFTALSADGRSILVSEAENPDVGPGTTWIRDLDGGARRDLEKGPLVTAAAFSQDASTLLIGRKSRAEIWKADGQERTPLEGASRAVTAVAFSPDMSLALLGHESGAAILWDLHSGKPLQEIPGQPFTLGQMLGADAEARAALRRLDVAALGPGSEATVEAIEREDWSKPSVQSVAFSPDGNFALIGSFCPRLLNVRTGHLVVLGTDIGAVTSAAFSPDGRLLATGEGGRIRIWDVQTREMKVKINMPSFVTAVAFSPDSRLLAAGTILGARIPVLDFNAKKVVWELDAGQTGDLQRRATIAVEFLSDGRLRAAYRDGTARIFSLSDGRETARSGAPDPIGVIAGAIGGGKTAMFSLQNGKIFDSSPSPEIPVTGDGAGAIISAALSPDGRFLLTGGAGREARLWDAATGRSLATLLSFDNGAWAVVDAEGRFDASEPDDQSNLYWVVANEEVELGQLKGSFYQAGLLELILDDRPRRDVAPLKRVALPPIAEVAGISAETLQLALQNRGGGIGPLSVRINGRELPAASKIAPPAGNPPAKITLDLPLRGAPWSPDGRNRIEVRVFGADGAIASRVAAREYQTPPAVSRPRLFAVVVGTSHYRDASADLAYADSDAADFARALRLAAAPMLGPDNVRIALHTTAGRTRPGRAEIQAALEQVRRDARADDVVVLFLAGHGVADRNRGSYRYLTSDADPAGAGPQSLRGIDSRELKDWLAGVAARNIVMVIDTCGSGAVAAAAGEAARARAESSYERTEWERFKDDTGAFVLMGSAGVARSYEVRRYGKGLLTYALLEAMWDTANPGDRRIDVRKALGYAAGRVPALAAAAGVRQQPQMSAPKTASFPLGVAPAAARNEFLPVRAPELLAVECFERGRVTDPLKLTDSVNLELRRLSRSPAANRPGSFAYIEKVGQPGGIVPEVAYTQTGGRLEARIGLSRDGVELKTTVLTIEGRADPAPKIAAAIAAMLAQVWSGTHVGNSPELAGLAKTGWESMVAAIEARKAQAITAR